MTALWFVCFQRENYRCDIRRESKHCTELQLWNNHTLIFYVCRCMDFKQCAWKYNCCVHSVNTESESTASSIAVFMCACQCACAVCKRMWFMRACIRLCVHIEPMHARRADYRVGLGAGNYCTVVKHHYSLICPLAPSVRLRTTSYTISTIPRTAPPTHPHTHTLTHTHTHIIHPSPQALAYRTALLTSPFPPSILDHALFFHTPSFSQPCVMLAGYSGSH